ncbi:MAG: N-acetylmuramoyl-L-alanine amidase [Planctomycetota bacterium]|nr:N-acetylmuramoyl-L-alanine amidase [Planctomycetota bacterium]
MKSFCLTLASLALVASVTLGQTTAPGPLFIRAGDLAARPMPQADLRQILAALLSGPTADERSRGLSSAIPAGCRLLQLRGATSPLASAVTLRVDATFLRLFSPAGQGPVELAIEQLAKTVFRSSRHASVFVEVQDGHGKVHALDALLRDGDDRPVRRSPDSEDLPPNAVRGALTGRRVAVSPGHGACWHSTFGWTWQRPLIGGLREGWHTNEICMRYLIPYLENMGASVVNCRDRGEVPHERIGDNDVASVYKETGSWLLSSFAGYNNGTYRYAFTAHTSTATATWTLRVPASASYPVHTFYRAGANRTSEARYRVHHAGGVTAVSVDQTKHDRRWVFLGDFWFEANTDARIDLCNESAVVGRVVIADAVRVGAGLGSIARGGRTSLEPKWKECSRYWAQLNGAPASVYDATTGEDHTDDVRCRPLYSEWRGADAYISLHTNAGGGSGTSSFIHNTSPSAGSAQLQAAVQAQIVGDIRRYYDATWIDRGRKSANFGEVRHLSTMPGVLVELAFHDRDETRDHNALHDPRFRRIGGRAYARGVMRYFTSTAPFPPMRPETLRVTQRGGALEVAWDPVSGATMYSIERSNEGRGFIEVGQTSQTSWSTGVLPHGSVFSFRVRAWNVSGRSFPSEVMTAGTSHDHTAEVLLVAGFDRLGKFVKGPENTGDYLRQHGDAIRRNAEFSLGFDAASNEAVLKGGVSLSAYRVVCWALGEESTADETFSSGEQALVRSYMQRGGRLFVSGAEIAWDLDSRGSAADKAFYRDVLGARYVRDDAVTYGFLGANGGVFAALGPASFDNGSGGTYDVDYPDVLAPSDSKSSTCLFYSTGGQVAGIQRIDGPSRVVNLGFPFETIGNVAVRADLMRRALRFLLAPRSLEMASIVSTGGRVPITVDLPQEAGRIYVLAASTATNPGIPFPGGKTLPLNPDPLFALSFGQTNGVFHRFAGLLDASGRGSAEIRIPSDPRFRGLRFFVSGLSLVRQPVLAPGSLLPWYVVQVR